eukprot:5326877-Alexandrium_andersonii.AAC.1
MVLGSKLRRAYGLRACSSGPGLVTLCSRHSPAGQLTVEQCWCCDMAQIGHSPEWVLGAPSHWFAGDCSTHASGGSPCRG